MKKISSRYKIRNTVASIGIFDSVHRGHRKILKRLVDEARREKRKSLVITFHPHPRKILHPKARVPFITSLDHRLRLIKAMDVDFLAVVKFTKYISTMNAEDFISDIMVRTLNIKALVVGENFLFGKNGKGDFSALKKAAKKYGFKVFAVRSVKIKGKVVSSTRIRRAIEKGDLKSASLMLGRPVAILGTVVKGRRVGRKIGFPTANIDPHHEAIPPSGVYAVDAKLKNRYYKAVLNIGRSPTFGPSIEPTIELHILDFNKIIYKKEVEIAFKKKLRNEKRFSSIGSLREQIKKDIQKASVLDSVRLWRASSNDIL